MTCGNIWTLNHENSMSLKFDSFSIYRNLIPSYYLNVKRELLKAAISDLHSLIGYPSFWGLLAETIDDVQALGYKHKRKSLEEIVQSTQKKEAELIGFNEEPIIIENANSIPLGKLQIQESEETPPMLHLPEARVSSSSINKFSIPSRAEGRPKAENSEACHGNKGQHESVIILTNEATVNQREINGILHGL